MANKPETRFRVGNVTATIWKNDSYFSVTLQRSYKDGDEWKNTDQLGSGDLLNAAKVLQRAETYISEQ